MLNLNKAMNYVSFLIAMTLLFSCGESGSDSSSDPTLDSDLDKAESDLSPSDGDTLLEIDAGDVSPNEDPIDLDAPPSGTARIKGISILASTTPKPHEALTNIPTMIEIALTAPATENSAIRIFQNKQPVDQDALVFNDSKTQVTVSFTPLSEYGVFDVNYRIVHDGGEETGYFVFYVERRESDGQQLDSVLTFRENSIKGPQYVNLDNYRLRIEGLVNQPLELSYDDILSRPSDRRVMQLNCVEGWSANVLWEGVPLMDLLNDAGIQENAVTVIFRSYDGYSTSSSLEFIEENETLLAYDINEIALPSMRGFPFQVAADGKWGYKWAKWVNHIVLSDDADYRGYWESYGYNQDGDHNGPIFDKKNRGNILPYCGHFD